MANPFGDPESKPQINAMFRLQWEEAQGCHVLLYPEGMVKLNASAAEILKHCDGETPVGRLIDELHRQFPDADLSADVYKFLETAHANGWIRAK